MGAGPYGLRITDVVGQVVNASLSQAGSTITGNGVSWNQTLAAGAVTQFGFCANR